MGLTDKHLAYGGDVPQTQTEKDYYWQIKYLEEQNAKLKEAVMKIKDNIKEWYWNADKQAVAKDPCVVDAMIDMFIRTIDNHLKEIEDGNRNKGV